MKPLATRLAYVVLTLAFAPVAVAEPAPVAQPSRSVALPRPDFALGIALGQSTFDVDDHDGSTLHLSGIADFGRLGVFVEVHKTEHDHQSRVDRDVAIGAQWSLFGTRAWDGYVFGALGVGFVGTPTGYAGDTEHGTQGVLRGGLGVAATITERLRLTFDVGRERRHLSTTDDPILQYLWLETDEWLTRARLGLVLAL